MTSEVANALMDIADVLPAVRAAYDQQTAHEAATGEAVAQDATYTRAMNWLTDRCGKARDAGALANDIERLLINCLPAALVQRIFQ